MNIFIKYTVEKLLTRWNFGCILNKYKCTLLCK